MKIRTIEKELYNDEKFLQCLPLLKEENWKKASPSQRLNVLRVIQNVISRVDDYFPNKVIKDKELFYALPNQNIAVCDQFVMVNDRLLTRTINPYTLISNYMFELAVERNYSVCDNVSNIDKVKNKKNKMMVVNYTSSMFGEWNNHFDRESKEFLFQPITHEAAKEAQIFTYDLLRYMHKKYGMDNYIGEHVSNLMISSFEDERKQKKVDENYKVMLDRCVKLEEEVQALDNLLEYCDEHVNENNDNLVYSLFNKNVICNLDDEFRLALCKWFCKRTLDGYDELDNLVNEMDIGKDDKGRNILLFGGAAFVVDEGYEVNALMEHIINIKIDNNLLWEIEDEDFKKEAKECYDYFLTLKDDNGNIECDYMSKAYAYSECQIVLNNYYVDLINECIKENKIFNKGSSIISKKDATKMQAFVQFAFNKSYEEIREIQFKNLKERAIKKGGR